jgi:hypothetical protein
MPGKIRVKWGVPFNFSRISLDPECDWRRDSVWSILKIPYGPVVVEFSWYKQEFKLNAGWVDNNRGTR